MPPKSYVSRLILDRFMSISSGSLLLEPLTIIVGPAGSGKTSVLAGLLHAVASRDVVGRTTLDLLTGLYSGRRECTAYTCTGEGRVRAFLTDAGVALMAGRGARGTGEETDIVVEAFAPSGRRRLLVGSSEAPAPDMPVALIRSRAFPLTRAFTELSKLVGDGAAAHLASVLRIAEPKLREVRVVNGILSAIIDGFTLPVKSLGDGAIFLASTVVSAALLIARGGGLLLMDAGYYAPGTSVKLAEALVEAVSAGVQVVVSAECRGFAEHLISAARSVLGGSVALYTLARDEKGVLIARRWGLEEAAKVLDSF